MNPADNSKIPKVTFTSFFGVVGADDNGWRERQALLHKSAIEFGKVDRTLEWSRSDLLKTEFYSKNRPVLDDPRGGGLWAWKPWVVLESLKTVDDDDYVIYHDIGKPFRNADPAKGGLQHHGNIIELPIHSIIRWAEQHDGMFPGVNTPHYGPASQWTKRDCFVGMDCDSDSIHKLPLVQAGYNAWKKTPFVIHFLEKWLRYCCDRRLISDDANVLGKDNLPDFSEHRHDQSVLTNLIRREGIIAYGSETVATPYVRNFNYLVRRIGLDQTEESGLDTLTNCIEQAGGSNNLPFSVTNWIDLDLANRQQNQLNILCIRAEPNKEEGVIRSFTSFNHWDLIDLSTTRAHSHLEFEATLSNLDRQFDWIFAYGFKDQASLVHISKVSARRLKPMGYLIAGLDHSHHFVKENTFASFIQALSKNRQLPAPGHWNNQTPSQLVVGTATNPVILKKRRGKPIVVSIQAGLIPNYCD